MDCKIIQKLISDYSVGLLSERQEAEFKAHVDSCPECEKEFLKFGRVVSMLDTLDPVEPPVGLWNGVYNRLAVDSPEPHIGLRERLSRGLGRRKAAGLSLGLSAAILLAVFSVSNMHTVPVTREALSSSTYLQGHTIYASQDYLADQAALTSTAALADRDESGVRAL